MAIFLSVLTLGGQALISPFSKPYSIIAFSFSLIVTGLSFKPHVQAASQGAGHTLEVNSGNELVFVSLDNASSRLLLYIRSFHSGIRLLRGHPDAIPPIIIPDWQNGTPQSIHLAP